MRRVILTMIALAWATTASAQITWTNRADITFSNLDHTKITAFHVGDLADAWADPTRMTEPDWTWEPFTWNTIDLNASPLNVPTDALAVYLSGTLVSQGAPENVYCSIFLTTRKPGSTLNEYAYQAAAVGSSPGGGFRTNFSLWTPVSNGQLQFFWGFDPNSWFCSMAVGVSIQAVALPKE